MLELADYRNDGFILLSVVPRIEKRILREDVIAPNAQVKERLIEEDSSRLLP